MGLLYGRAGRLTAQNGGFRPGQEARKGLVDKGAPGGRLLHGTLWSDSVLARERTIDCTGRAESLRMASGASAREAAVAPPWGLHDVGGADLEGEATLRDAIQMEQAWAAQSGELFHRRTKNPRRPNARVGDRGLHSMPPAQTHIPGAAPRWF